MELKRAVITGLGAISPIGIGIDEIKNSLVSGKSGITSNPEYKEMGMNCLLYTSPSPRDED